MRRKQRQRRRAGQAVNHADRERLPAESQRRLVPLAVVLRRVVAVCGVVIVDFFVVGGIDRWRVNYKSNLKSAHFDSVIQP